MTYTIKTLNAISPAIYTQLSDHYRVSDDAAAPDAILVRSASMHETPIPQSVLSIARAAAANPRLLLLDEITANLDAETENPVSCPKAE